MSGDIGAFVFFIVIDLILLLRIIKLYVNTEVVNVKLIKNHTTVRRRIEDFDFVNQQWEGKTKDGEPILAWYPINRSKKMELKEDGTYRKIIYDRKAKTFITTPFKRILVDIAFIIFILPTFFGEVTDEILVNVIGLLLLLVSALAYGYFRIKPNDDKITIKENKKKRRKKKPKILDYLGTWIFLGGIFIIAAIPIFYEEINNRFTDEDWNYMYEYIDQEFGKGEHFHIISQDTDIIREKTGTRINRRTGMPRDTYDTLGIKVSIMGYFDSQDCLYVVSFSKYLEDNKLYEAGEVSFTSVNTNYSKEEYLKGVNTND